MALYKQPYGNRMEKRAALRKDGIFAKIKAKREAKGRVKDTKEAMGHDVKEEKKADNNKKAQEVTKKEMKSIIPENASVSIEKSNTGISTEAQKIIDAAGTTGHSGFTTGTNANSGGYAPGTYVNIDRSDVSGASSSMDITRQSDRDNSGHVEGKVQAFTGNTTELNATTGTLGKIGGDGANLAFDLNSRFGETTVRNPATYSSTVDGKGIGVGANNTQVKYRMPGTGTFGDKGFGLNIDGSARLSGNNFSIAGGAGYSSLMPEGSKAYGFVEGGMKGSLFDVNKWKKKHGYSRNIKSMNLSMPFNVKARASTGAPNLTNSWLPMNSLHRNAGIKANVGLNLSNAAKDRSIEVGFKKDYQNSILQGQIHPYVKAKFGIFNGKNDKRLKLYE